MDSQVILDVAALLQWMPVDIALVGGLWALAAMRREPIAGRADAGWAGRLTRVTSTADMAVAAARPNPG